MRSRGRQRARGRAAIRRGSDRSPRTPTLDGREFPPERAPSPSSQPFHQDWLYPLIGRSLGQPTPWTAPTDTWQEWVNTGQGPAIVTGGYRRHSLTLRWTGGRALHLHGGQVYLSSDREFGLVVGDVGFPDVVHPCLFGFVPAATQPVLPSAPITVWDFAAGLSPRRLATIHLPPIHLPKRAGSAAMEGVLFAPNDRYWAISVQGNYGVGPGMPLVGQTFLYATASGRLVGIAPCGNGMEWTPDSKCWWLGTPYPEGHGEDRLVDVRGQRSARGRASYIEGCCSRGLRAAY